MPRRCAVCGTEYPNEVAFCGHDGSVTIEVTPPGEDPDPRLGAQLGDYIIVAHVADGAMGAVYEARNASTRERVAIKVLHTDVAEDDVAVERFNREFETAGMFQHPNIVKVLDFGETADGSRFLTMEYLVGQELGELLRREGPQRPARTLRVLAQVARALEHAHSFGVIHRDLKPDNVFLCASPGGDDVRLLDFGSVKLQVETGQKLTAFGTTLGSPFYMSPEQAKGLPDVDGRTDVFAMAAILYEALSGKVAFDAPSVAEILMKIVRHKPAPLTSVQAGLPAAIDPVIDRGLAKDKKQRFDSPGALMDAALVAFGVQGSSAHWAERPESELEAALAAGAAAPVAASHLAPSHLASPGAPSYGATSTPHAAPHPPAGIPSTRPAQASVSGSSSGLGLRIALLAGAALLVFVLAGGLAAVFLLR